MSVSKLIFLSIFYSSLLYAGGSEQKNKGFDTICQIYTEAINSSMTKKQLSEYIFDNIKSRVVNKDALEAHAVIFQLEPPKRYAIFKKSAEYSLKRNWHCDAMKEIMK